jgi:hypothetical protein
MADVKKYLNIRLTEEQHATLKSLCSLRYKTTQEVVEKLILDWIRDHKAKATVDVDG